MCDLSLVNWPTCRFGGRLDAGTKLKGRALSLRDRENEAEVCLMAPEVVKARWGADSKAYKMAQAAATSTSI